MLGSGHAVSGAHLAFIVLFPPSRVLFLLSSKRFFFLFKQMSLPFTLTINAGPSHFSQIRRSGFIICDLSTPGSTTPKRLGYCLHCKRLFSLSWVREHARRLRNKAVNISGFFNEDKVELYRHDIISEVEVGFPKFRFSSRDGAPHDGRFTLGNSVEQHLETDRLDEQVIDQSHRPVHCSGSPSIPVSELSQVDESAFCTEHDLECAKESLLTDSFFRSEFHADRFLSLAETMTTKLFSCSDKTKMNSFKASVITILFRRLSVILSLSKKNKMSSS